MSDNHLILKKDSVIFYKVNLLLDVEFEEDAYLESNKLNSFFGQIGVYENSEKLLSLVKNLYKDLFFDYLVIKEKSDFKQEEEDYDMFFNAEENIFKDNNNGFEEVYNDESLVCLESEDDNSNEDEMYEVIEDEFNETSEINDDEDDDEDENEDNDEDNDEDGDEEYFSFFLPLIMIFYRGDRKMDYYLGNEFKEKLYFKKKIVVFKEKIFIKKFLKKIFFFKKKYKINFFLKKFNKKGFFSMIKNNNVIFIFRDFIKYHFFDVKRKIKLRRQKRFRMFKKLKLKSRSKMLYVCKDNKWWNITYILFLLNLKFFFLSNYYSHKNYLIGIFNFFSQMINIKKKFFRRYRRKRRFKRNFFRNFFGKKAKLNIILNIIEEDKKKKKRR